MRVIADWMRSGAESKAKTFSLWGGGETGCTAQEDLKSISSYTMGEGRMIRVWFSFLYSFPLGFLCSSVLGSPPSSLSLFLGPILWPLLICCSRLTIYLFPFSGIWEPGLRGRGAMTTLASSGCRGVMGL